MRRRQLEYVIGDLVYLKVSPKKRVKRFDNKRKLYPHCVGPYKIVGQFINVEYKLELSVYLASVHPDFHVSQ